MQTVIEIDDALLAKAREVTGIVETSDLVVDALRAVLARDAARKLIALGGSDPNARNWDEVDDPST